MAEPQAPERLGNPEIHDALSRLNELLADVELSPGPAGEVAVQAVTWLARVYGEALARAIGYVADTPALREVFLRDELIGHLLVLHGIHPESTADRVARAVTELSDAVRQHGGEIELAGIEHGTATVRLAKHGCGSSTAGIDDAVRDALLAVAPELSAIEVVSPRNRVFIPVQDLLVRPATTKVTA